MGLFRRMLMRHASERQDACGGFLTDKEIMDILESPGVYEDDIDQEEHTEPERPMCNVIDIYP